MLKFEISYIFGRSETQFLAENSLSVELNMRVSFGIKFVKGPMEGAGNKEPQGPSPRQVPKCNHVFEQVQEAVSRHF